MSACKPLFFFFSGVLLTCVHALIMYCTYGSMFECVCTPYVLKEVLCECVCAYVSVCVCVELSRDQHTCRWVFITAGLSDGLAYGRPLFIVISLHLISPHSQVRGDH